MDIADIRRFDIHMCDEIQCLFASLIFVRIIVRFHDLYLVALTFVGVVPGIRIGGILQRRRRNLLGVLQLHI